MELTAAQQQALREFSALLTARGAAPRRLFIIDGDGRQIELPPATVAALTPAVATVTAALTRDPSLALLPDETELTTTQAARFLQISRQYLARLLDQGVIPYRMVGTHHRVRLGDLRTYKARQRAALRELAQIGEELGLDDE